jgi:hypothetical protein
MSLEQHYTLVVTRILLQGSVPRMLAIRTAAPGASGYCCKQIGRARSQKKYEKTNTCKLGLNAQPAELPASVIALSSVQAKEGVTRNVGDREDNATTDQDMLWEVVKVHAQLTEVTSVRNDVNSPASDSILSPSAWYPSMNL